MQSWNQNEFCYSYFLKRQDISQNGQMCVSCLKVAIFGRRWYWRHLKITNMAAWVFRTLPSNALRFTLHCKTLRWNTYKPVKYSEIRGGVHCDEIQYSEIRSCALRWDTLCRRAASPHGALMLWRGATCSRVKNSPQCSQDCGCITNSSGALQCFELNHNILRCAAGWRAWAARGWLDWCLS